MRSASHTHAFAKRLRRNLSPPEILLWVRLRIRTPDGPVFRRQHPIGPYVADFYCPAAKLVVEIDGAHHGDDVQLDHDEIRDRYMETRGYRVVRYPAADVLHDPDEAARSIFETAAWWRDRGVR